MHLLIKALVAVGISCFGCVMAHKVNEGKILQYNFVSKPTLIFMIGLLLGQIIGLL
jgi:hypothetical protein